MVAKITGSNYQLPFFIYKPNNINRHVYQIQSHTPQVINLIVASTSQVINPSIHHGTQGGTNSCIVVRSSGHLMLQ
jgi:hypothetical protein